MYTENINIFPNIGILFDFGIHKECPHHLEVQVISFSNFYNQGDHKNSVVNSQDLIEEIQVNNITY